MKKEGRFLWHRCLSNDWKPCTHDLPCESWFWWKNRQIVDYRKKLKLCFTCKFLTLAWKHEYRSPV